MKKYPYIGKGNHSGAVFLFFREGAALRMQQGENSSYSTFENDISEGRCTNITHEHLKNTWGVVESKEHAEFIVELAELHGFELTDGSDTYGEYFSFDGGSICFVYLESIAKMRCKKITIPLPPKADKQDVSEWPKVGDKVLIDVSGYDVIYGKNIDGLTAVVRSIFKDGEATVYAVSRDGACYCFTGGILKKPKTTEEELRDDLINTISSCLTFIPGMLDKSDEVMQVSHQAACNLIARYNITKKPQ